MIFSCKVLIERAGVAQARWRGVLARVCCNRARGRERGKVGVGREGMG